MIAALALLLVAQAEAQAPPNVEAGASPVTIEGNATVTQTDSWSNPSAVFGGLASALMLLVGAGVLGPGMLKRVVKEVPLAAEDRTALARIETKLDERTVAIDKRLDEGDRKRELHGNAIVLIMNKLGINGPHETLKHQIEATTTDK